MKAESHSEQQGAISELDTRCSTACTRAGYIALLLSAAAFGLLEPLAQFEALDAYGSYVALRINLKETFEELYQDECWNKLGQFLSSQGQNQPEDLPIGYLYKYLCSRGTDGLLKIEINRTDTKPVPTIRNPAPIPDSNEGSPQIGVGK